MPDPSVETQLALLTLQMADLKADVASLDDKSTRRLDKVEAAVELIVKMSDRWKGGFLVIVAFGSVVGWILTFWDRVTSKWH